MTRSPVTALDTEPTEFFTVGSLPNRRFRTPTQPSGPTHRYSHSATARGPRAVVDARPSRPVRLSEIARRPDTLLPLREIHSTELAASGAVPAPTSNTVFPPSMDCESSRIVRHDPSTAPRSDLPTMYNVTYYHENWRGLNYRYNTGISSYNPPIVERIGKFPSPVPEVSSTRSLLRVGERIDDTCSETGAFPSGDTAVSS